MKGCAFNLLLSVLGLAAIVGAISLGLDRLYAWRRETRSGVARWRIRRLDRGQPPLSALTTWRERGRWSRALRAKRQSMEASRARRGNPACRGVAHHAIHRHRMRGVYLRDLPDEQRIQAGDEGGLFRRHCAHAVLIVTRAGSSGCSPFPISIARRPCVLRSRHGHATDFVARTTFEAPPPPVTRPS